MSHSLCRILQGLYCFALSSAPMCFLLRISVASLTVRGRFFRSSMAILSVQGTIAYDIYTLHFRLGIRRPALQTQQNCRCTLLRLVRSPLFFSFLQISLVFRNRWTDVIYQADLRLSWENSSSEQVIKGLRKTKGMSLRRDFQLWTG